MIIRNTNILRKKVIKIFCAICGKTDTELHHIIKRSQCKPLVNCKLNLVNLCVEHHRGTQGVHSAKGKEIDRKLRLEYQNIIEMIFDSEYITISDIVQALEISENNARKLVKALRVYKEGYNRNDIIIACMGGKREV